MLQYLMRQDLSVHATIHSEDLYFRTSALRVTASLFSAPVFFRYSVTMFQCVPEIGRALTQKTQKYPNRVVAALHISGLKCWWHTQFPYIRWHICWWEIYLYVFTMI